MVIIHETDKHNYIDKQRYNEIIKYSNGVKKLHTGNALYLPRRDYIGTGVLDVIKLVADNKDTIQNVADVASTVVDTVADSVDKIGTTTLGIVRKIRGQVNKKQEPTTEEALNKVLESGTSGNGFYYI